MKAYKCDRCGKLFEIQTRNGGKHLITILNYNNYFDLCEDCQNELDKWMNKFKKNINGESEE